jgi:hypothetical protein
MFLRHLLNALVQIANKMELQKIFMQSNGAKIRIATRRSLAVAFVQ